MSDSPDSGYQDIIVLLLNFTATPPAMDLDSEAELVRQLFTNSQASVASEPLCVESQPEADSESNNRPESQNSTPSQHLRTTSWWAPLIKNHLKEHIVELKKEDIAPRVVISACAGACSEAEVLRATGTFVVSRVIAVIGLALPLPSNSHT